MCLLYMVYKEKRIQRIWDNHELISRLTARLTIDLEMTQCRCLSPPTHDKWKRRKRLLEVARRKLSLNPRMFVMYCSIEYALSCSIIENCRTNYSLFWEPWPLCFDSNMYCLQTLFLICMHIISTWKNTEYVEVNLFELTMKAGIPLLWSKYLAWKIP